MPTQAEVRAAILALINTQNDNDILKMILDHPAVRDPGFVAVMRQSVASLVYSGDLTPVQAAAMAQRLNALERMLGAIGTGGLRAIRQVEQQQAASAAGRSCGCWLLVVVVVVVAVLLITQSNKPPEATAVPTTVAALTSTPGPTEVPPTAVVPTEVPPTTAVPTLAPIPDQSKSILRGHTNSVHSVVFSPDGTLLASASHDKTVRLWNVKTGQLKATLVNVGWDSAVAFSPDGTLLALANDETTVRLWNVETNQSKNFQASQTRSAHPAVCGIAFSPDGTMLAWACSEVVWVWDIKTGQTIATLQTGLVSNVAFSPDGTLLATAGTGNMVRLWVLKTGQPQMSLGEQGESANSIAFSPDGTTLAGASGLPTSAENAVSLWSVQSGRLETTLRRQTWVLDVAFSPDGTLLASAGTDHTIVLWDVRTGKDIATLQGHTDIVSSVAFSPDGTLLASGGGDGTVRLWDVPQR